MKISILKKQLEEYFRNNRIEYAYINKAIKKISIPIYICKFKIYDENTKEIETEIPILVAIFKSAKLIYFETIDLFNVTDENYIEILKMVNSLNIYSFPGKFFIDNGNMISYRCSMDYSKLDSLNLILLEQIIDSIPPAYYMLQEQLKKVDSNDK